VCVCVLVCVCLHICVAMCWPARVCQFVLYNVCQYVCARAGTDAQNSCFKASLGTNAK